MPIIEVRGGRETYGRSGGKPETTHGDLPDDSEDSPLNNCFSSFSRSLSSGRKPCIDCGMLAGASPLAHEKTLGPDARAILSLCGSGGLDIHNHNPSARALGVR